MIIESVRWHGDNQNAGDILLVVVDDVLARSKTTGANANSHLHHMSNVLVSNKRTPGCLEALFHQFLRDARVINILPAPQDVSFVFSTQLVASNKKHIVCYSGRTALGATFRLIFQRGSAV
jgi:hypothetical protein